MRPFQPKSCWNRLEGVCPASHTFLSLSLGQGVAEDDRPGLSTYDNRSPPAQAPSEVRRTRGGGESRLGRILR